MPLAIKGVEGPLHDQPIKMEAGPVILAGYLPELGIPLLIMHNKPLVQWVFNFSLGTAKVYRSKR